MDGNDPDLHEDPGRTTDVIVLGSHLATGLLAAALARQGVRVTLVRTEADRTTPAGETTVPYTAELFFLLGTRFEIPEIWDMGMFDRLPEAVRATSGTKRSIGFLYHRAGQDHRSAEALQFNVPQEHAEWHPRRPDVDEYAEQLAERYGAAVERTVARGTAARVGAQDAVVELADGRSVRGQLLIDGSGDRRLLPEGVSGLVPARARHTATLLTARLPALRPFESVVAMSRYGREATPWSEGTLLHAFDHGWVQLVPFGNHLAGRDPSVGVVASFDPERWPDHGGPGTQFEQLVSGLPQLARQFSGSAGEPSWKRYEHWPALADPCAGPRWFLFDRSAGRHDFLLSRDVSLSLELVHAVVPAVLAMARSGDWSGKGLREAADFQVRMFALHDRLVTAARTASGDFRLWSAFLRVWLLWSIVSTMSLKRARLDGPDQDWATVGLLDRTAFWYAAPAGLPELLYGALDACERVAAGAPAGPAAERIFDSLRAAPFAPPLFAFGDPQARYYNFTRARRLRTLLWSRITARAEFRSLFMRENVTGTPETPGLRK